MSDAVRQLLAPYALLEIVATVIFALGAFYILFLAEHKRRQSIGRREPGSTEGALYYRGEFDVVLTLQQIERRLGTIEHDVSLLRVHDEARAAVIAERWGDTFRLLRRIEAAVTGRRRGRE